MPSSQQDASPLYFSAKGLSDALDATDDFPGAMASLQNLVFDPSATDVFQCRPAGVPLLDAGPPNPILSFGFVSVFKVVGDMLYGMVATRLTAQCDQPFAFNLLTNAIVPVAGITSANVPTSPPVSGDWTPPTMDVVGTYVVVTHPGFSTQAFATAMGFITFNSNPANLDTITLGGSVVTFVTATPVVGDNQVQILSTLALTLASLPAALMAFGDPNISQATYGATTSQLLVSYVEPGASGNAFTLAASAGIISGATLTGGTGNYFGWFNITDPANPVWNAGNMAINPLPTPPTAVAQFNSRAYFLVNPPTGQPALIVSDPLNPLQATNGSYVMTFGDNQRLTALAGLPLTNQLGGVIQSMIVFKGVTNMFQVTGDPLPNTAAGAWAKNALNVATGTLAPRSIVTTPQGLYFMSPQGYRLISFTGQVSPPVGANGKGVSTVFILCQTPSRAAAAANATILRASVISSQGLAQEFWLDIARQVWTGPHTLAGNMIAPYKNTFLTSPTLLPNSIYQSDWLQNSSSTFQEFGATLAWGWQTSLLPDAKDMQQHEVHETIVKLSTGSGAAASMIDEAGNVILDTTAVNLPASGSSSAWGQPQWTGSLFYGQAFALSPVQIPWPAPVVFGRACLQLTGLSDMFTRIGALSLRYEPLGYLPQPGN